jgi:dienelactone hydrolase
MAFRIADQFAANGYFVVMPDLFHGDPVPLNRPEGFDIFKWRAGPPGHNPERVDPVVDASIKEMRKLGVKKLGAVGYCFGAKYVVRFLKKGVLDAGYVAHPSFVDADELKGIEGPLSIAAAGKLSELSSSSTELGPSLNSSLIVQQRLTKFFRHRNVARPKTF